MMSNNNFNDNNKFNGVTQVAGRYKQLLFK